MLTYIIAVILVRLVKYSYLPRHPCITLDSTNIDVVAILLQSRISVICISSLITVIQVPSIWLSLRNIPDFFFLTPTPALFLVNTNLIHPERYLTNSSVIHMLVLTVIWHPAITSRYPRQSSPHSYTNSFYRTPVGSVFTEKKYISESVINKIFPLQIDS